MEMQTGKVLVLTVDAKGKPLRWLDYMLRSAKGILDGDVRVFICTDSPEAVSKAVARIGFGGCVEVIDVRKTIADTGLDAVSCLSFHGVNISPLQMFRLAIPLEPAFLNYDKVVFSDVDVGFESSAWNRIFDEDVEGVDALAVRDCKNLELLTKERCRELAQTEAYRTISEKRKGELARGEYYAAGLMVMNLKRLRSAYGDYGELLKRMIHTCIEEKLPQLDQSLINLYFAIREISPSYNAWSSNSKDGMPVWMRHFPGPQKVKECFYPPKNGKYVPPDKVDIVYTVGLPSAHNDQELRWSLRSIAKYGRNIGRVIVTSPVARDWLSNEVIQVDAQDIPGAGYKHHNILYSILATIDVLSLHGEFLVSSDDHFYVRETDFARYPFNVRGWTINQTGESSPASPTAKWKRSCMDTGVFLRAKNLPTVNFQGHANSHWNADLVRDERALFKEAFDLPYCVEPHVLMQNLWLNRQPDLPLRFRKDAKIQEFSGSDGVDCISCFDFTFIDDRFIDFMTGEFGEKCRYEK